jgi:hypothetical protein
VRTHVGAEGLAAGAEAEAVLEVNIPEIWKLRSRNGEKINQYECQSRSSASQRNDGHREEQGYRILTLQSSY